MANPNGKIRFSLEDQCILLEQVLSLKPLANDKAKWDEVQSNLQRKTGKNFTDRSVRDHLSYLVKQYNTGRIDLRRRKIGTDQTWSKVKKLLREYIHSQKKFKRKSTDRTVDGSSTVNSKKSALAGNRAHRNESLAEVEERNVLHNVTGNNYENDDEEPSLTDEETHHLSNNTPDSSANEDSDDNYNSDYSANEDLLQSEEPLRENRSTTTISFNQVVQPSTSRSNRTHDTIMDDRLAPTLQNGVHDRAQLRDQKRHVGEKKHVDSTEQGNPRRLSHQSRSQTINRVCLSTNGGPPSPFPRRTVPSRINDEIAVSGQGIMVATLQFLRDNAEEQRLMFTNLLERFRNERS